MIKDSISRSSRLMLTPHPNCPQCGWWRLMVNDSCVSGFDYAHGSTFQLVKYTMNQISHHNWEDPGNRSAWMVTLRRYRGITNFTRCHSHSFTRRCDFARNLIPFKGQVLNMISEWAFSQTKERTKTVLPGSCRLTYPWTQDHIVRILSRRNSLSTLQS